MIMMRPEMSTLPAVLDDETISAVRAALGSYVQDGDPGTLLRDTLRTMASEAKARGITAERLLVVLKGVLNALPELRKIAEPIDREKAKQRIVTACIEQYYQK